MMAYRTLSPLTVQATGKSRVNLSLHHLFAACRSVARIAELEQANAGAVFGGFWEEILHNCLGVATLTVACLESYANELYFEGHAIAAALNAATAAELKDLTEQKAILSKYSLVLAIRSNKRLELGENTVQDVEALIRLRNAVVHFRPEWHGAQLEHDKLSKRLQHRFEASPFLPNEPLFPMAWASHSFAVWALRSSCQFLETFHEHAGLPSPIDPFRRHLRELSNNAL